MRLSSILSFLGFALVFAGTYCPLLRPFHLFNWDVYQMNQPYGLVLLLVATVGIITSFLNQRKVVLIMAWIALILVALLLVAAILKVKFAFNFIPFHGIEAFMARQIKFKWGWYVLFAGAVLALVGALSSKPKSIIMAPEVV